MGGVVSDDWVFVVNSVNIVMKVLVVNSMDVVVDIMVDIVVDIVMNSSLVMSSWLLVVDFFGISPVSMWKVLIVTSGFPLSLKVALWVSFVVDGMLVVWEWLDIVLMVICVIQLWVGLVVDVVVDIVMSLVVWMDNIWLSMANCSSFVMEWLI